MSRNVTLVYEEQDPGSPGKTQGVAKQSLVANLVASANAVFQQISFGKASDVRKTKDIWRPKSNNTQ